MPVVVSKHPLVDVPLNASMSESRMSVSAENTVIQMLKNPVAVAVRTVEVRSIGFTPCCSLSRLWWCAGPQGLVQV